MLLFKTLEYANKNKTIENTKSNMIKKKSSKLQIYTKIIFAIEIKIIQNIMKLKIQSKSIKPHIFSKSK